MKIIVAMFVFLIFTGFATEKFESIEIKYEPGLYIICPICHREFYECHNGIYIGESITQADCRPLHDYVPEMSMSAVSMSCPWDGGKPHRMFWNTIPPGVRLFTNEGWMAKEYRPKGE